VEGRGGSLKERGGRREEVGRGCGMREGMEGVGGGGVGVEW